MKGFVDMRSIVVTVHPIFNLQKWFTVIVYWPNDILDFFCTVPDWRISENSVVGKIFSHCFWPTLTCVQWKSMYSDVCLCEAVDYTTDHQTNGWTTRKILWSCLSQYTNKGRLVSNASNGSYHSTYRNINILTSMKVHKVQNWLDSSPRDWHWVDRIEITGLNIIYSTDFGYRQKMPQWSLSLNYFIAE